MSEFETYTAPPPAPQEESSREERQWALFGHLSALTGLFTGGVGNIVGPLVIWLVKKDSMPFASDQAKEALNFNITLLIVGVILFLITLVTFGIGVIVTAPLGLLVFIAWLVLTIIAAVKANDGIAYRSVALRPDSTDPRYRSIEIDLDDPDRPRIIAIVLMPLV